MEFSSTSEQRALVTAAHKFAGDRIAPFYQQRALEQTFDRETIRAMGELGFFGVDLPEEYGGLGQDCLTAGLVVEALSGADYNLAYVPITVSLVGRILLEHGDPQAISPWLDRMTRGEAIPCIALTEPGAGSDAAALRLRAVRDGEEFVLNGEKTSISMATQADVAVVFARTGDAPRHRGISAFLVPLDTPGISTSRFDDHGADEAGRGSIFFDDVRLPADHLIGDENAGFAQVMVGFDYSRALIGLQSLAVARQSLDETWLYIQQRQTFGEPLSSYQGVTFPLAEAETHYTAARLMCLQALWLRDQGLPHARESAMCKWWAVKLAYEIVMACLLSHGHAGYSQELPFEQRLRDLLGLQIGDGTAQIMKLIISRSHLAS